MFLEIMDYVVCCMLFYFGFHDLRNLLLEFGIIPNGMYKPNLLLLAVRLLNISSQFGIDHQSYVKRIIKIFDELKNSIFVLAEDPRNLTTKMLVVNEIVSSHIVLRACTINSSNTQLKIPYENIQHVMDPTFLIGDSAGPNTPGKNIFCHNNNNNNKRKLQNVRNSI